MPPLLILHLQNSPRLFSLQGLHVMQLTMSCADAVAKSPPQCCGQPSAPAFPRWLMLLPHWNCLDLSCRLPRVLSPLWSPHCPHQGASPVDFWTETATMSLRRLSSRAQGGQRPLWGALEVLSPSAFQSSWSWIAVLSSTSSCIFSVFGHTDINYFHQPLAY